MSLLPVGIHMKHSSVEKNPVELAALLVPEKFAITRAALNNDPVFLRILTELIQALEAGQIRKADHDRIKSYFSYRMDKIWDYHIWPVLGVQLANLSSELKTFFRTVNKPMGLYQIKALYKKAMAAKVDGELVKRLQDMASELLPLAECMDYLKDHLVSGRAPSNKPAQPENPNKKLGTCSCCFRQIAIMGEHMAHHGYQRPGQGYQTASCAGIRFKPLEQSTAGLEWLITVTEQRINELQQQLANVDSIPNLMIMKPRGQLATQITRDMPEWPKALANHKNMLISQASQKQSDLVYFKKALEQWQEYHRQH